MESPLNPAGGEGLVNRQLGSYQVQELLGRGGMAVVYKALQPSLDRFVAVKVLPSRFVQDAGLRERFQSEARTVARLEHPHILSVYDFGQVGDIPYLVMPLVAGGSLRDWLRQGVTLERALKVFDRILSAVGYAHRQRIIHRDIKPGNILMKPDDWPLLTDFGIATMVQSSARREAETTVVGTPEYMAPEQAQGLAIDHRADLYAMGVILFLILAGRLPFRAKSPRETMQMQVDAPIPSARAFNPSLAPEWDALLERCLAKRPAQRFADAEKLAEAIQVVWQHVQAPVPPPAAARSGGSTAESGADVLAILYERAVRAVSQGDWPRAILACEDVLEYDANHAAARELLSQVYESLQRQRAAPKAERASVFVHQGQKALANRQLVVARRYYEAALELMPDNPTARAGLDQVAAREKLLHLYEGAGRDITWQKWTAAAEKLRALLASEPDYRDAAAMLAQVTPHLPAAPAVAAPSPVVPEPQGAVRFELESHPTQEQPPVTSGSGMTGAVGAASQESGSTWLRLGASALASRDWAGAVLAFQQVLTLVPDHAEAAARLAEARREQELSDEVAAITAALAAGRAGEVVGQIQGLVHRAPDSVEVRALIDRARPHLGPLAGLARSADAGSL